MSNVNPIISIITPYYNSGLFLERTIKSIQNQQYSNWELILVDDGSSDNGPEIIAHFAQDDKRVLSFKRPSEGFKSGGRGAKNYGYLQSKGKYVVFFDSDDYMLPNYLSERVCTLEKNSSIDVVFSDFGWKVSSDLSVKKIYRYHPDFNKDFNILKKTVAFWKSYTDLNFFWVPSNMMWKSSAIQSIKWNESTTIGEDFEFNSQAILAGLEFMHLNENTWFYMRNELSMMATSENPLQIEKRSLFMSIVLNRLIESKFTVAIDDLIAHFIKDQYRFIRRIIVTQNSLKDRWLSIQIILKRIEAMRGYFENDSNRKYWRKKAFKARVILFVCLSLKRGFKFFKVFLIGKRVKSTVLISQIVSNKNKE
jgi:glycosyltransferase involved in cell wall biosynthesis